MVQIHAPLASGEAKAHSPFEPNNVLPTLVLRPFRSEAGLTASSVRRHPGLWMLKLNDLSPRTFRAVYEVDGQVVRFLGFGPRPYPYRRLGQRAGSPATVSEGDLSSAVPSRTIRRHQGDELTVNGD
jgi:hypothetical protein